MRALRFFQFRHLLDRSLAFRFIVLVGTLMTLTIGTMGLMSYQAQQQAAVSQVSEKSDALARFLTSISPERILSYDLISLDDYVRELTKEKDVIYVVINASDGKPLTSFLDDSNAYIKKARGGSPYTDVATTIARVNAEPEIMATEYPINFGDRQVGTVKIGITREYVDAALRHDLGQQAIVGIVCLGVLSIGIFLIFRANVVRPVLHLMNGARRIANGNLDDEISVIATNELGMLTRTFNQMMRNLKRSDSEKARVLDQLQELNRTLEIRVEERTRAAEQANKKLEHIALYDALTDLPNRTLFNDRLEQGLRTARRDRQRLIVMMMDLDRFKEVNDTLGHPAGDELLKEVARRVTGALRPSDTVARLGGDEFAILLPGTDAAGATVVADKVLAALELPFAFGDFKLSMSASLGFAVYPDHGDDLATLLKRADIAMYVAKQNKTGYVAYDTGVDKHSPSRLAFMSDVRAAVDQKQFTLYYQPIISVATGRVVGVEALARWNRVGQGFVSPDEFIPVIEQTGLIRAFTHWVLDTALQQLMAWRRAGVDLTVSVNLSMRNLQDRGFSEQLRELMRVHGVPAGRLILEITESVIMNEPEYVTRVLNELEDMGAAISIDDFGTGYSSLSLLKRLPVQQVKIDKSFVMDMSSDRDDFTIVRSIVDLAHNLDIEVVAEGIESKEIVSALRGLGCDKGQGFHIGRPAPPEALAALLTPVVKKTPVRRAP